MLEGTEEEGEGEEGATAEKDDMDDDPVQSFSLHLTPFTVLTFFCIALSLVLASASGIGGGGILVPIYILMLGAPGKVAIPLSNATILGGGLGNNVFTFQKRHPERDAPMIDYDTVLMLEPLTIFGAVIGSFLNKVLPEFVLILLLATSLALTAIRTMRKGLKLYAKESAALAGTKPPDEAGEVKVGNPLSGGYARVAAEDETTLGEAQASKALELPPDANGSGGAEHGVELVPAKGGILEVEDGESEWDGSDEDWSTDSALRSAKLGKIEAEEVKHPYWKIALLAFCFVGVMALDVLKDEQPCGSPAYWTATIACIPWVFIFTLGYRRYLMKRQALKAEVGYRFLEGDVDWNERTTLIYPVLCTAAGFLAGMFGVGGGMIKGPLVLEMGLTPLQAHATGMFMILFTSGSACVTFFLFGQLNIVAGSLLFVVGLLCTAVGQYGFDQILKRNNRQSMIIISMASVISLSAVLLTTRSIIDAASREDKSTLINFGTLCRE
uniref:Sulfite exporter TauE/SafE n=1 Tax=Rhizochromulina marina TaxID=1034831 RepID=A0A7S2WB47_9STRA|mmetsp:Transcript_19994/g.58411  ORF Transcript_19994/g.58411 Transcript_19994/m.58411 type:complete len:498 (+) Transcript_19994:3-1496(+)